MIELVLKYTHPEGDGPVAYQVQVDPAAVGTLLQVADALDGVDDPDEIRRLAERVSEAMSG